MRSIVREGIIAGALAATAVALWFFAVDLALGQPFDTPERLGRALFGALYAELDFGSRAMVVVGYTIFHYLAFFAVGLLVAAIVAQAASDPSLLAGALILFVMFEVGFHALLSIFGSMPVLGTIAWYNVAIGNIIAAITMGGYIWRVHPELKAELTHALESKP